MGIFFLLIVKILAAIIFCPTPGTNTAVLPLYMTEIPPVSLRGAVGLCHQLGITGAILLSQILGLSYVCWHDSTDSSLVPRPLPRFLGATLKMCEWPRDEAIQIPLHLIYINTSSYYVACYAIILHNYFFSYCLPIFFVTGVRSS